MLFAAETIASLEANSHYLGLHWADWAILCAYLLGITALGVWSFKKVSDSDDFFMGGRRFGKVFMMFFAFGSGTSSEHAISVSAGSFRNGLAGIWYQFLWLWATPFYWIVAPVLRRMRALTTSDFFEARYDTSTSLLYSILGMCISITFISASLFFGAKMVTGLSGGEFPVEYAVGAMTVMFVIYGLAGGLGAAVITDFVQGILTIIFSFLLLPFALHYAAQVTGAPGGFAALHLGVPGFSGEDMLSMTLTKELAESLGKEPITIFYIVMMSINALIGIVVQPHIMGVCGAGKTEYEGRFGFTVGNFMKRLCTIAWTFTGLACVIIYLTPGNGFISPERLAELNADPDKMKDFADSVFGYAAHDILPRISPGLVGLLFASLLAAIMSSCDAHMVMGSGLFTENIYRKFINPKASEKVMVWVGRFSGIGIVALSLLLMSQFDDAIQVLTRYVNAVPAFIGLAFWFGIIWRGYTPAAVWTSTLTAAGLWYLTTKHSPFDWTTAEEGSKILQRNIDYLPGLFREWLWDNFPFTKYESLKEGKVATSIPWQYVIYLGGGAGVGLLTSFLTKRPDESKLEHFFTLLRTPVRPGEKVHEPCTLPENPLPPETGKLIPIKDIELPAPSFVGMAGFIISWIVVGLLVALTWWLAQLGG
ncbi:sodium:solute symporter family protein [Thalassoglobus polymorphus]|uniref:Sodium/proline symporter n=1 Tax=Thalassoglobus polymorphus TaxID=2527994 RepID=A0A517QQ36_9PLAN|nr:sodium:solute symporter family protein [Thalassoglobus polymorphus]QDT33741.1 Sodium/proline symporter [Thalassoglobus polymorphus]